MTDHLDARFDETDAQVIVDTAITAAKPEQIHLGDDRVIYEVLVPRGAKLELLDPERFLDRPRRLAGVVRPQTVAALVRYVERHDNAVATTLWVDGESHTVVAVFNDHEDLPGWGDHRAVLQLKLTDAWKAWIEKDGKLLEQQAFAEHIEDNLIDIVNPDGATMLEIAQSIEASTSAEFKQAQRLTDGQVTVQYVEQQTAKAGQKGDLTIPERFELGIAPFVGEDAFKVSARLRYRIRGGTLMLGYKLDRPQVVLETAIDEVGERLGQQFDLSRVFIGKPREAHRA